MDSANSLKYRLISVSRQVGLDLRSLPPLRKLVISLIATLCLTAMAWLILPDFADLNNIPAPRQMLKIGLVAFFFPALFEEIVFRGFLNATQTKLSITLSTILFVIWHPFAAAVFIPEAMPYMIDTRFLLFVTLFGIAFCLMRKWTRSLWTPVLCHWVLILIWKGLGGVQFLTN